MPNGGSTMAGAPLSVLDGLIGGPCLDDLLTRAAADAPGRLAIRAPDAALDYAALDRWATGCAAALRGLLGDPPDRAVDGAPVVALAMELSWAYPVAVFGIARAGLVSALINPLLPGDRLVRLLGSCRARAAIVPPRVYRLLAEARHRLPDLEHLVLTTADPALPEVDGLAELIAMSDAPAVPAASPVRRPAAEEEELACLQFTSGTTGDPKVVRLTHRNLTVNAAQTAYAHRLRGESVLFNFLPTFHLMHLTAGVNVAATHVLHPGDDIAGSVRAAARQGATHYYSLPVRLSRLADHPDLPGLEVPGLEAILSGGSALPPAAAEKLHRAFGVPVVQGYGLAETSPSMHLGDLDDPRPGSSGRLVPGGESRIVDVDTGEVLPVGAKGEIQVRGPQLMQGYLGRDLSLDVDADGWFSTGDIGLVDADGHLFVVDRIKDVWKCDNWLVAPTDIERVLADRPGVADCVVFDHPDPARGAVAHALVVPDAGGVDVDRLVEDVNSRLPYYEHLHHLELTDTVPRSPTGKVNRRELRERALDRHRENQEPPVHYFINKFTVTGDVEEFHRVLGVINEYINEQPGFRAHRLYQSTTDPRVYVETSEWEDAAAHRQATSGEEFLTHVKQIMRLATADPGPFELVREHAKGR
ncbi:AMP-binding protein [Actinomadura kijaniata]|uniref:AMP-binding protein n=1 Tax=Actinomadura kijaniata TaxID=46161 RepID=UPI003F1E3A53